MLTRRAVLSSALPLCAWAGLLGGCTLTPAHPGPPAMGKAPKFALPSHMGPTYAMRGLITKGPGVVVFYRGASSPYCRTHLAELANHHEAFTEKGVLLVAISSDEKDDSFALAGKLQIPFPLLRDADGAVAKAYGVSSQGDDEAIPAVFVIDRKGRIVWRFVSETVMDRPAADAVLEAALAASAEASKKSTPAG